MKFPFTFLLILIFIMQQHSQTLTLNQCLQLALQRNYKLREQNLKIEQSRWLKRAAFTHFLFSIDVSATYLRMNKQFRLLEEDLLIPVLPYTFYDPQTGEINTSLFYRPDLMSQAFLINPETGLPVVDVNGNPVFLQYAWLPADHLVFGEKNNYLIQWTLRQPVYMGGKIRHVNSLARTLENISKIQYDLEVQKTLFEVEKMYWDLIVLIERRRLVETYEKLLQKLIIDIKGYLEEGIVLDNTLLKTNIQMQEVRLNKLKIDNGFNLTRKALCQKIGLPLDQFFLPADTIIPTEIVNNELNHFLDLTTENRTELKLLKQSMIMGKTIEKLMISRFLPQISLLGMYNFVQPNPYSGFTENFGSDYMIGLSVQIPIFHWHERFYTWQAAKAQYRIYQLQYEDAQQQIVIQTELLYNQIKEKWMEMEQKQQALTLAERNLQIMQDKWEAGMCKISDLLEAEVIWYEAHANFIEAKANYRNAILELKKSNNLLGKDL